MSRTPWGIPPANLPPQQLPQHSDDGKEILWRSQTYRLRLLFNERQPIASERYLAGALLLFPDNSNFTSVYLGTRDLSIDGAGLATNSYFPLSPGRTCFIWTDNPGKEWIDVNQIYALHGSQSGVSHLHVTIYFPTTI